MHTKAVYRAAQGLNDAGLAALRFNFRGVGTSTGSFDGGIGEEEDARAALNWLEERYPYLPLVIGGFSFGSMVGMTVGCEDDRVAALLGLGLPVELEDRYDYDFLGDTEKPTLVVQGERDEFGSGQAIAEALSGLGEHITLVRIPDTDHFFDGKLDDLRDAVGGYFGSGHGARVLVAG
jgi:alpha/beta superfamily hydrolase